MFQKIKNDIKKDIMNGKNIKILQDTKKEIVCYTTKDYFDHFFQIKNPKCITEKWLKDNIIVTPDIESFIHTDHLAHWMITCVPKTMYLTLQKIIIIGDDENAFDYLSQKDETILHTELRSLLEEHDLPNENQFGIAWTNNDIIIVSLKNIINETNQMIQEGYLYDFEKFDCVNHEVTTTIVHELRHLAQNNPYLHLRYKDIEKDAEQYARKICDSLPKNPIVNNIENIYFDNSEMIYDELDEMELQECEMLNDEFERMHTESPYVITGSL